MRIVPIHYSFGTDLESLKKFFFIFSMLRIKIIIFNNFSFIKINLIFFYLISFSYNWKKNKKKCFVRFIDFPFTNIYFLNCCIRTNQHFLNSKINLLEFCLRFLLNKKKCLWRKNLRTKNALTYFMWPG